MKDFKRNNILDITRGLGIIIITIYHLVYRPEAGIADKIICGYVWLLLPFFFLSSGYNFHDRGTFRANIFHRFKALMLPALKYSAVLLLIGGVYCVIFHNYTARDLLIDVINTYLRPEFSFEAGGVLFECISPVWFIWAMMSAYCIFYAAAGYALKNIARLSLSCTVLLSPGIIFYDLGSKISWNITSAPVYASIMLCGAYISRHSLRLRTNAFMVIAALLIHSLMIYLFASDYLYANVLGTIGRWSVIPLFIQTFIGAYFVIALGELCSKVNILSRILIFIGKNSFDFMMLHGTFSMLFSDLLHTFIKFDSRYWYIDNVTPEIFIKSLAVWLLSLIGCWIFCVIKNFFGGKSND